MNILGVEQRVQNFKDKGMQTQYEVKFLQSVFSLKVELLNYLKAWTWINLYPSNGTEGPSQSFSSIWKFKDHGSCDMAWKPSIIFNFEHQTLCMRVVVEQPVYTFVV
jgi:hypothetical protein